MNIIQDKSIEWRIEKDPIDFEFAVNFMEKRVEEIIAGKKQQMIWILEHNPVYTAGISAKEDDLLNKTNIPIFKTNRGGKYTYHGPGMKIIYVMLNLKTIFSPDKPDIARFVKFLENWVIEILSEFKIHGEIRKDRVGVWVLDQEKEKKISAIGIKIKKWVSYHGIAINLDPDLKAFDNIVPCGIKEFGVTSIKKISDKNLLLEEIAKEKFNLQKL